MKNRYPNFQHLLLRGKQLSALLLSAVVLISAVNWFSQPIETGMKTNDQYVHGQKMPHANSNNIPAVWGNRSADGNHLLKVLSNPKLLLKGVSAPMDITGSSVTIQSGGPLDETVSMAVVFRVSAISPNAGMANEEFIPQVVFDAPAGWSLTRATESSIPADRGTVSTAGSGTNQLTYNLTGGTPGLRSGDNWDITVDVVAPSGSAGMRSIVYTLNGDGFGPQPHTFTGSTAITVNLPADPNAICVNVFRDFNSNGIDNGAGEPGISGVTVTAYDAANTPTVLTDNGNGNYAFTPGNGDTYRVEVTGLMGSLEPSVAGATTLFFMSQGNKVDVGLHEPNEFFPDTDVHLAVPCYVEGGTDGPNAGGDVLVITPVSDVTAGDGNLSPTEYFVADHDEIGATFGVAYSRAANSIFAAAFTKRHTGFGPGGPGAIYRIDLNGDRPTPPLSSTSVTTFLDLNGLFAAGTAGANPHPNGSDFARDPLTYDAVGKIGLGGLALAEEDNVLWTIGLNDRRLYEIPLGGTLDNPTAPTAASISTWPATGDLTGLPGLTGAASDIRPFAVKFYRGEVFISLVNTAESTVVVDLNNNVLINSGDQSQMTGFVYKFDPVTDVFTKLLEFPLNYNRGQAIDFCGNNAQAEFFPWVPIYDSDVMLTAVMGTTSPAGGAFIGERAYPQPWITDIEFDEEGKMLIGIRDRFADQHGYDQPPPNTMEPNVSFTADGAGDVLVASINTTDNTTYVLENNSSSGTDGAAFGPTVGINKGEGPGNGEFFFDDRYRPTNASADGPGDCPAGSPDPNDQDPILDPGREQGHDEISTGGLFHYNGNIEVYFSAYDPINNFNNFNNAGIVSLSTIDGSRLGGNQIYATPADAGTFAKGNGLGDLEGIGGPAPIQIGNRLWFDTNNDGIQNPDEPGINGVLVELFISDGMGGFTKVAETTTAADPVQGDGAYTFTNSTEQTWFNGQTEVLPNTSYEIRVSLANVTAQMSNVTAFTTQNAGGDATNNNMTDLSDSDASDSGVIAFTTGNAGENNHTLDIGARTCTVTISPNPTPSLCTPATNEYTLDVEVTYVGLPPGEMIVITTDNGANQSFTPANANSGTETFTLTALNSDGVADIDVTAAFSTTTSCTASLTDAYTAPQNCTPACEISITNIDIQCTNGTDFTVAFNVEWDYLLATADMIQVTIGGVDQAPFVPIGLNGAQAFGPITLSGPAYDVLLEATFVQLSTCSVTEIVDLVACTPDCVEPNGLGGNAFNDFDNNGENAGAREVGQENVLVEVYDCEGNIVCSAYTNAEGNWSCDIAAGDYPVRVEFSTPLQPYLQPGFAGADNGTSIQFVAAPRCDVDYGVIDPSMFCQEDPDVVVTCFVVGDPTSANSPFDVVVNYPQSREGADVNDASYVPPNTLVTKSQAGSVWGTAIDRGKRDVYVSTFFKRHIGLLENDPVSGAPFNNPLGVIYATNLDGGPVEVLIDLSSQGVDVGMVPNNATRGVNEAPNQPTTDSLAYTLIGKVGLGDITLDEENNVLYAINLFEKTLVSVVLNDDGTTGAVSSTPIPDPGCSGGEMRPFAVEVYQGEVYLGVVCDGSTSTDRSDLTATVYRGDGTSFLPVIAFPLDYPKGFSISSCAAESQWQGWSDTFPQTPCAIGGSTNSLFFYSFSQPMLTNIDFDADGAMVLSFTDRFSHQMGYNNADLIDPPEKGNFIAAVTGDLLRVARLADGTYELENNATAGNLTATPGVDNGEGPGGGEFYFGDFAPTPNNPNSIAHSETGQGTAAINPVTGVMTVIMTRPGNNTIPISAGTSNIVAMDGTVLSGYSLFEGTNSNGNFGKGGGLGDLVLACDPVRIQIGNYAWIDTNADGIQQACEDPLPGLTVKLYRKPSGGGDPIQIAGTETDANGNYYFSSASALSPGVWTGTDGDSIVSADSTYFIAFCGDSGFDDSENTVEIDGISYCLTAADMGEGTNPDLNDSDATVQDILGDMIPAYCTRPGEVDTTNHNFDVGFKPTAVFDLALIKTLDLGTNPGPFSPGGTVDFNITVFNQGDTDATDIEVKDYVPEGLSLAPASAPNWTISVDTAILTMPFSLAAGEDSVLNISFVIDAGFMGDTLVNRAEISNFDDDNDPLTDPPVDEDSTPNDNGDTPPEADTPDEIDDDGDGTPGMMDDPADEDDYDWEGIPVIQSFDLALIKRIDMNATPGPFTYGSTVTFVIEVKNQGSLDATDVEVADYIPDGLTLVASPTWTTDVDTARLAMPFDLAAGATETLSISFTIDDDFSGTTIDNVAEITAAENALGRPDEDSVPGDNGNDDPEVDTDDEENDNGPNGNGTADNPDDSDDFDLARVSIETVSLGSTVFLDLNNNGLQNAQDTGIANVEVQLFDAATGMQILTDATGARVIDAADAATVTTDADGNYHFTNLIPGDYYVVIPTTPTAAPLSSNNTGIAFMETDPDDNLDSDDEGVQPGGTGTSVSSDTITLALGDEPLNGTDPMTESGQGNMQDDAFDSNGNMTLDFGFFAPVSVGDTAFVDLDGNGLQDMGEPGIGGVTVTLIDTNGDTVMIDAEGNMIPGVTMTAPDGSYLFENLPPGSYSIIFDISTADNAEFYDFTTANAGIDTDDSDNSVALTDSTAQSDFVPFLFSGEEDLSLDVGVVCAIEVIVAEPFTICSTQPIVLNDGASITPPSLGGSWSTPDGTGEFTTGTDFATATTYIPSSADAQRGSVTLILTTDEPDGPCDPVSNQVTIQILNVDCGDFFWDGQ